MLVIREARLPVWLVRRLREDVLDGNLATVRLGDRLVLVSLFQPQQNGSVERFPVNLAAKQIYELVVPGILDEDLPEFIGGAAVADRVDELIVHGQSGRSTEPP